MQKFQFAPLSTGLEAPAPRQPRMAAATVLRPAPPRSTLAGFRGNIHGMADENSRRLDRIESHVAHLEHQVEELNGVVIEQGKLLDRLKREAQRQSAAMHTLELERINANQQKPPHYQ
jgi:SlyX protein